MFTKEVAQLLEAPLTIDDAQEHQYQYHISSEAKVGTVTDEAVEVARADQPRVFNTLTPSATPEATTTIEIRAPSSIFSEVGSEIPLYAQPSSCVPVEAVEVDWEIPAGGAIETCLREVSPDQEYHTSEIRIVTDEAKVAHESVFNTTYLREVVPEEYHTEHGSSEAPLEVPTICFHHRVMGEEISTPDPSEWASETVDDISFQEQIEVSLAPRTHTCDTPPSTGNTDLGPFDWLGFKAHVVLEVPPPPSLLGRLSSPVEVAARRAELADRLKELTKLLRAGTSPVVVEIGTKPLMEEREMEEEGTLMEEEEEASAERPIEVVREIEEEEGVLQEYVKAKTTRDFYAMLQEYVEAKPSRDFYARYFKHLTS